MRILMGGSSGLVGTYLVNLLRQESHEVVRLLRRAPVDGHTGGEYVVWNPSKHEIDPADCEHFDVVVHLGGAGIGDERWSPERKRLIYDSRVGSSGLLAQTLAKLQAPPRVLLNASAIGVYGDRGDELLDEDSAPGQGFLAEVGRDWEAAADPARQAGIRVVHMRFGLVLDAADGALAKMLPPFRLGLGGPLASGRQYMPWITLGDLGASFLSLMASEHFSGPVNIVSPKPVTNEEFSRTLASVLKRPCWFRVPAFAIRWVMGEMGTTLALNSSRVVPKRLLENGFAFTFPDLKPALEHVLDAE